MNEMERTETKRAFLSALLRNVELFLRSNVYGYRGMRANPKNSGLASSKFP